MTTAPELTLAGEHLELDLSVHGARITALRALLPAGPREVMLPWRTAPAVARERGYLGATVGRYANRIGRGHLEVDGVAHRLPVNDRGNTLHGGPEGFDTRTWQVVAHDGARAELELVSPDGEQGFPGTVTARAAYEIDGRELRTTYTATTDAPTHVSLSSHAYFAPGGTLPADVVLTVHADHVLPVDPSGLPTGELRAVDGTAFDLRRPTRLGDVLGHPDLAATDGYDHPFLVAGEGMRPVAVVEGGGLRVEIDSDQPGVQLFSGGADIPGVALEPQHHPDSPHHPEWPSTLLRPGETYRWVSVVRVLPAEETG